MNEGSIYALITGGLSMIVAAILIVFVNDGNPPKKIKDIKK